MIGNMNKLRSLRSSWPDLFRPSECFLATEEHEDARDKPAYDDGEGCDSESANG